MIHLQKIDLTNIWKITNLSVNKEQESFVAPNDISILEAYAATASGYTALPFAIYNDGEPVGFVMFGYDTDGDEDSPAIAAGSYCIWRFMIDKKFQGKGYGKAALKAAIDYVKTGPCGQAEFCWLSYEPENTVAKALYCSMGFAENGEVCGEEIVSVLRL